MHSYHGQQFHIDLPSASDLKALTLFFRPLKPNVAADSRLYFYLKFPSVCLNGTAFFTFLHKLHLTVHGRPVWPMKIKPNILLLEITRYDWMGFSADT
jgi:hypothetical protein